jgi:predicted nucleic acid-binding protein
MRVSEDYKVNYLFDTSSVLCYLLAEPHGKKILSLKSEAALPFIALTELYYILWQKAGKESADTTLGLVKSWHLPLLLPDEHISLLAGYLKARYGLGIADSYIAAFALAKDLTLVTKDEDYEILKSEIKILSLRK